MKAMILAAGYGKRLQPLTNKTPKPLLPVAGKPLLQHHIEHLASIGITDIIINTSWLAEQIEDYFGDGSNYSVNITWSREFKPLETGGGINKALPFLGEAPFLLINGDIWTDFSFSSIENLTLSEHQAAWLLLVENTEHNLEGDFGLEDNMVSHKSESRLTFSGISLLKPQLIKDYAKNHSSKSSFPLRDVLSPAIQQSRVIGSLYPGQWCDVGTPERYKILNNFLNSL